MEKFKRIIHPKDYLENSKLLIEYIKVRADSGEEHFIKIMETLQKAEDECDIELNTKHSSPERAKWFAVKGDIFRHRGSSVEALNEYYNKARDTISNRAFESSEFKHAFDSFAEATYGQAFIYAFFRNEKQNALDLLANYWQELENHREDTLKYYDNPIKPNLIQGLCYPLTNDVNRKLAYHYLSVMIEGSLKDCHVQEFAFLDQILIAKAASTIAYLLCGNFKDIPHDELMARKIIDRWYEKLYFPEAKDVILSDFTDSSELFSKNIYEILDTENQTKLAYAKFQYDFADLACHAKDFWEKSRATAAIHYKESCKLIKEVYEYCDKNNTRGNEIKELKALYHNVLFHSCGSNEIAHIPYYHGPTYLPEQIDEGKFIYRIMNAINYFGYNKYRFPLNKELSEQAYRTLSELENSPEKSDFQKLEDLEQMVLAVGFVYLAEVVGNKKWGFDGNTKKAREILISANGLFSSTKANYIIDERLNKFKKTLFGGYSCEWIKVRI